MDVNHQTLTKRIGRVDVYAVGWDAENARGKAPLSARSG